VAYAVAHSTNTVSVRVLEELSKETSFDMAKNKFHLKHLVHKNGVSDCDIAALALGQLNYGITLRELVNAYTVFADRGCYHPCRSYYRVTDGEGRILLSSPDSSEIVLSEENAAIMTKLLQGVVKHGTSSSVTLDRLVECAGKTGTTQNDHDRLFVGYTPDIICGVWCGYSYPEPLVGANICTGIWNNVMTSAYSIKGGQTKFEIPKNVHSYSYCKDSGKLIDDSCLYDPRGSRVEIGWFVDGSEPKELCDCHILSYVDEENGGVSHGECPDSVLKKTSLVHVERHFPMQVLISDAQYIWRGDPLKILPSSDPTQPYFATILKDFCGKSLTERPHNRSCQAHQGHLNERDEEGE
jgi:penicillin-binding protein 1A